MYFQNPAIIKDFNDVKIGMVETDAEEMSYNELIGYIKNQLEDKIKDEVESVMTASNVDNEEALALVAKRTFETLDFYEEKEINSEADLADAIVSDTNNFTVWKTNILLRFQAIHPHAIQDDTPVATQGTLELPEQDVMDAVNDTSYPQILELLRCMAQ